MIATIEVKNESTVVVASDVRNLSIFRTPDEDGDYCDERFQSKRVINTREHYVLIFALNYLCDVTKTIKFFQETLPSHVDEEGLNRNV